MLIKMENSAAVSGRRRGTTKHSVEDQALDQIAKEKIVNVAGERHDVNGVESEEATEQNKHELSPGVTSGNGLRRECFVDDESSGVDGISEKDSVGEKTKLRKISEEQGNEMKNDKEKAGETRNDKGDNDRLPKSDLSETEFDKNEEKFSGGSPPCDPSHDVEFPKAVDISKSQCEVYDRYLHRRDVEIENNDGSEPYIVDFLGKENCKAEARLAARRQARAEAREIRLRELERQQKESEENADKVFDMSLASENILRTARVAPLSGVMNAKDRPTAAANSYHSSRRSSEDSVEDGSYCLRDIKHELKELDEKFRKAMIANAQLDNEKSEVTYQVELLKDKLEDLEETHSQLSRECRDKTREHEQLKRVALKLKEELSFYKSQLEERDKLISDYGLVIVGGEVEEGGTSEKVLVSKETAELLEQAGDGSLDVRLKKLGDERNELLDEVRHLKLELEEERNKKRFDGKGGYGSLTNGPLDEETSKLLADYRFKLQKAEQDVSTLQANVARLESQVIRYKSAAESSEKAEDELKIEKRKLQRENRESIARIEELETANSHLMRRMDKLKNAKSTLLKEL